MNKIRLLVRDPAFWLLGIIVGLFALAHFTGPANAREPVIPIEEREWCDGPAEGGPCDPDGYVHQSGYLGFTPDALEVYAVVFPYPDDPTRGELMNVDALSGYVFSFSFQSESLADIQLIIKVLDGCGVNGRRWVTAVGLTDHPVSFTITDLVTDRAMVGGTSTRTRLSVATIKAFECHSL